MFAIEHTISWRRYLCGICAMARGSSWNVCCCGRGNVVGYGAMSWWMEVGGEVDEDVSAMEDDLRSDASSRLPVSNSRRVAALHGLAPGSPPQMNAYVLPAPHHHFAHPLWTMHPYTSVESVST